jgi:uncharacterized protein YjaG (DUF416 family)
MLDEAELEEELLSLAAECRVAFAASCCERMLPNYQAFSLTEGWGDYASLRGALDTVWSWLGGEQPPEPVQELARRCGELAPDTEEFTSLFVSAAGDAAAAVSYTLECCLDGDAARAATVGRLAAESVYMYLLTVNDPLTDAHAADPSFEREMKGAPLMRAEVGKQRADLDALKSLDRLDSEILQGLLESSARSGISPLERGLVVNRTPKSI